MLNQRTFTNNIKRLSFMSVCAVLARVCEGLHFTISTFGLRWRQTEPSLGPGSPPHEAPVCAGY